MFLIRHKCSEQNWRYDTAEVLEMRERYGDFIFLEVLN